MHHLGWLFEIFDRNRERFFMIHEDRPVSYSWLIENVRQYSAQLDEHGLKAGTIAALRGDYSPQIVAALLALVDRGVIVVPLSPAAAAQEAEFLDIAEVQAVWSFPPDADGESMLEKRAVTPSHPLFGELVQRDHPGLVLFSSGSTGKSKAALHDFARLLDKFKKPRRGMVTLTFLMIDHIGGINTLLHVLSNAGTVVVSPSRDPHVVCATIAAQKVELLPTSPTFLNLLVLSEAYNHYDLSSLKLITYGTEMMPKHTLERISELLPHVTLQQTYGLSEVGILRSKSERSDSLWVRVGGEGYETKVKDGTLWIKAQSAMMGYLNASSPFDAEGWLNTGDLVEVQGEYVRFLGRATEIINVGGQKVYPAEVENVLMEIPNVRDVTVSSAPNPITGNIVVAHFNLSEPEDFTAFKKRVREFCRGRLDPFKIPARMQIVQNDQFSGRFKKMRCKTE
ncbi:MAG: long-chain fatty acid--CoA ligase [Bryobacteraceae bacterium]